MAPALTDSERAILDFEAHWQRRVGTTHVGAKEEAIRSELELAPARYYQLLSRLVQTGGALAYDPMLVKRLRRLAETQAQPRTAARRAGLG